MQRIRSLWLGVATTRKQPLHSKTYNVHLGKRFNSQICNTAERKDEAKHQMENKLQDELKSDSYLKILSMPLRRCAFTQLVLPKAMLFQLISLRQWPDTATQEDDIPPPPPLPKTRKEPPNALLRRRTRRWLLKEDKKTKQKQLLRSQRMMQHKVVTSITEKSRQHFTNQLNLVKEQLQELIRPLPPGELLPFGLTRTSIKQSRGIARGKGLWVTLNKKIVADVGEKKLHKLRESTLPIPSNLPDLLQEGLEQRVVEEAQILLQQLKGESYEICNKIGWLIRRTKGQETREMLNDGLVKLRDGDGVRLACLILASGEMPALQQNIDSYDLQILFQNENRKEELIETLRKIAVLLNTKQRKERKRTSTIQSKEKQIDVQGEEGEKVTSTLEQTLEQGKKWPRIHAVKRDERTVELCISLWRLQAWCQSDKQS